MKNRFGLGSPPVRIALVAALLGAATFLVQDFSAKWTAYAADATPPVSRRSARTRVNNSLSVKSGGVAKLADTVILGTNSVYLKQNAEVLSGDVVANDVSPGPFLAEGVELTIGQSVDTPSSSELRADSIKVKTQAIVGGDVYFNELTNNGTIIGSSNTPLALPVFSAEDLPDCEAPSVRAGAPDLTVPIGGSASIDAGEHGEILIKKNGVLTFTGGEYLIRDVNGGISADFLFEAPSVVRIEEKFDTDKNAFVGPAPGSGVGASEIRIIVGGINGNNGNLGATPKAAQIGLNSEAQANFCVPNGTLWLRQNSESSGSFIARDVILGIGATASLSSAFGDLPPTADPQNGNTVGQTITLLLTGSDPEGLDLTFAISIPPTAGSLANLTEIDPPAVLQSPDPADDCTANPTPPNCELSDPPISSATVQYTPGAAVPMLQFPAADCNTEAEKCKDPFDTFTFSVTDVEGGVGLAVVTLNEDDPTVLDDPLTSVEALDVAEETAQGQGVVVSLDAGALVIGTPKPQFPEADCDSDPDQCDFAQVPVVFSIVSLPSGGSLDDGGTAINSVPFVLAGDTVNYTPNPTFSGTDSFDFKAAADLSDPLDGDTDDPGEEDTATATVTVFELAPDQEIDTFSLLPVDINLASGGSAGAGAAGSPKKVAGSVAISDGQCPFPPGQCFVVPDNVTPLPGPSPLTTAAGIGQSGGAGQDGTVRLHMEFQIDELPIGFFNPLQSATVRLTTNKVTGDSEDTFFFVNVPVLSPGTSAIPGDGLIEVVDYGFSPLVQVLDGQEEPAVMSVPAEQTGDGTFSFDITGSLQNLLDTGQPYLVIQGRVANEFPGDPENGLHVYTTASGNLGAKAPVLDIVTVGAETVPVFSVLSLPSFGTLTDSRGAEIVEVPTVLPDSIVNFDPEGGVGNPSFSFSVDSGVSIDSGLVVLGITVATCEELEAACDDGR